MLTLWLLLREQKTILNGVQNDKERKTSTALVQNKAMELKYKAVSQERSCGLEIDNELRCRL